MKRRILFSIILFALIVFVCCFSIFAQDLDDVNANTALSGWAFSTQPGHMGKKEITYSFYPPNLRATYDSYVISGKALWGTNIKMTYTALDNTADIVFSVFADLSDIAAVTQVDSYDSTTGHRIQCHIYLNSALFSLMSSSIKSICIAHEIGHAYGLGHVDNTSSIMYDDFHTGMSVQSEDIWGMKVVTHVHIHGTLFMGTYEVVDATYHTVTCNSCKAKITRVHAPNAYGVCACGYTGPFLYP